MHRMEAYFRLALIFTAMLAILYLPVLFYLKKRGKSIPRQVGYLGLICSLFLIAFATIFFTPITFQPETHTLNLIPFVWLGTGDDLYPLIVEKIPNVLLFIPLGFFLPAVFKGLRRFSKVALVAFLTTFSIEFLQFFIGRSSDIDDVIANFLGGVIGYLAFRLCDRLFRSRRGWNSLLARR
ncbi:Glycopeptide antibiotics resistance protein [Bittarella massiliensis (ex Durand et al. 2017)]|uniref:Glycopeptide antibiotics resistance protein n=2 Tax=Bittarella massiliensis (ex Durand et al. 2017) TaxID=1720313 RepID=A0AAQ1MB82_9FIRM|nr:Glycopeptide antibiotics resistance protein [Bittarella massiliensis (ex Durand et al. 2017)]